jgi:hypothetical protein
LNRDKSYGETNEEKQAKKVARKKENLQKEKEYMVQHQQLQQQDGGSNHDDANSEVDDELEFDDVADEIPSNLLRDLQQSVNEKQMKWHERVELITKLGKVVSMKMGRDLASPTLSVLQDIMNGKNVNVHVLRASTISIGRIGYGMKKDLVRDASFRVTMIELLKLLKSKQVMEEAKQTLKMLHGRCFTLKNILPLVNDCLGLAKKSLKAGEKGGAKKGGASMPRERAASGGGAVGSTTEIVEWLADSIEEERFMKKKEGGLDFAGLEGVVDLFLNCVANRDVKCRRAAQDGLVGALVFGVLGGLVERSKAFDLLVGLETSNAKIYSAICKNVSEEIVNRRTEMELELSKVGQQQQQQNNGEVRKLGARGGSSSARSSSREEQGSAASQQLEDNGGGGGGGELNLMWNEVQYLLRKRPSSSADVDVTLKNTESALYFLNTLEVEAARMGMLRGGLSRCILPYDENTSTLDQANVSGSANQEDLDRMDLDAGVLEKMRVGAVDLRNLVRVKIADDGDLDLAMTAVTDVAKFFKSLKKEGAKRGVDSFDILSTL